MALSWLFRKKKIVPQVPFPEGKPFNERTFQFSKKFSGETLIEPEHLQAAAGFNQPFTFPESESPAFQSSQKQFSSRLISKSPFESAPFPTTGMPAEPVYVKVEVYQKILGELDDIKSNLNKLQETNRKLESSEYNEEHKFDKLRRAMKITHDRLLQIDKTLFKGE